MTESTKTRVCAAVMITLMLCAETIVSLLTGVAL